VLALVVTYNRIELLKRCVAALERSVSFAERSVSDVEREAFSCDILVVDNASTDGTQQWLKKQEESVQTKAEDGDGFRGRFYAEYLPENRGGAGGFSYGMKKAYEMGYDFVWIMDDDTLVHKDTLKELLKAAGDVQDPGFGFLSSTVLWIDGTPCKMNRQTYVKKASPAEPLLPVKNATFVSLLFSREAMEKAGLPISEYFIWGDDKEYTGRVSDVLPCYHVTSAAVTHAMKENAGSNIVTDSAGRIDRYFYAYRNDWATARSRGVLEMLIYVLAFVLNGFRIIWKARDFKKERLRVMCRGFRAGVKFHPEIRRV